MKKSSKRLVYVLSTNTSNTGHSLGVNSVAVDPLATGENASSGTLYSAGRDGIIHSWGLNGVKLDSDYDTGTIPTHHTKPEGTHKENHGKTVPLQKEQLHTNWVNDIVLANENQSLVSCSSDLTVKLWTPQQNTQALIGQHRDYVKCLASPSSCASWVVSGGLDRRILGWDLAEQRGEKFCIDNESSDPKHSIYALDVNPGGVIAAGGPESIVRLYDSRTRDSIVRFIGHTDNVRAVKVSQDGQWVLSASSDSTIKLWSVTASRNLHTFDMHDDSVWSLFSNHDDLSVFYSGDRTGLVCKTDLRGGAEENGVCSVVCNEHQGVSRIVARGDYIWTATSNSCIHRWSNFDTTPFVKQLVDKQQEPRRAKLSSLLNQQHQNQQQDHQQQDVSPTSTPTTIPASPTHSSSSSSSTTDTTNTSSSSLAVNFLRLDGGPSLDFIKHRNSNSNSNSSSNHHHHNNNNYKRLDNDMEDDMKIHVEPLQQNAVETLEGHIGLIKHRLLTDRRRVLTLDTAGDIKLWDLLRCKPLQNFESSYDIDDLADELNVLASNTASISNWCQLATRTGELYVTLEEGTCFDGEVYADEEELEPERHGLSFKDDHRINIGRWIITNLLDNLIQTELAKDKRIRKEKKRLQQMADNNKSSTSVSSVSTIGSSNEKGSSTHHHREQANNSSSSNDQSSQNESIQNVVQPTPQTTASEDNTPSQPSKSKFMGRLRGLGKSTKKNDKQNGTASSTSTSTSTSATAASTASNSTTATAANNNNNNTAGAQKPAPARPQVSMKEYIDELRSTAVGSNSSAFTPPPRESAPPLELPPNTKIMLSEQTADAGGTMDLYRGTVGSLGDEPECEQFENVAPEWLARVVLQDELPSKEGTKVGFTLQPFDNNTPQLAGGASSNLRLTAYQMLRARKVLVYLLEKLDPAVAHKYSTTDFELICNGKLITPEMTLASIRTKIWRSSGDVVLRYRVKK